jgi:hypothetical protein
MDKSRVKKITGLEIMVFKTSLTSPVEIKLLSGILDNHPCIVEWNIDLDDWEKILKIKSRGIEANEVKSILGNLGILSHEIARGFI